MPRSATTAAWTIRLPYPAHVQTGESGVHVHFPDFDDALHVTGPSLEATIAIAQDALLRRIMTLMRHGKPIPPPDHYLGSHDESHIMHLDPHANCEQKMDIPG